MADDEPIVEDVTEAAADWSPVDGFPVEADGFRTLMPGVRYREVARGRGPQAERVAPRG